MAALVTLNGIPVTEATVSLPRTGVWHAEVVLEQLEAFSGSRATLQFGPKLALTGAVRRSGAVLGSGVLMLLGGSGNLDRPARPQAYQEAPVRLPLGDLLQVAEEQLSAAAQQEVLNLHLAHWVVSALPVGVALAQLMTHAVASWRSMPDGTLWVGVESWPDTPDFEHVLLPEQPLENLLRLQSIEPAVLPGQSFLGRHVSYVEHHLHEDELGTQVYLEAA